MSEHDHIDAVRGLAQCVLGIADVDVPEMDVSDEMVNERDNYIDAEGDDAWWDAWCAIYDTVAEHVADPSIGRSTMQPDVDAHERYDELRAQTDHVSLTVSVYADGDVSILAEYDRGHPAFDVLFEGRLSNRNPDPIEMGRLAASAELATIVEQTGSSAAALDYWQTELAPYPLAQRQWADVRRVNRQTVNDRVRDAREQVNQ